MEFQVSNDVSNVVISYSTSSDMSNAVTLATIESATAGTMCLDGENLFGLSALLFLVIISNLRIAEDEGFNFGDDITLQVFYHDEVTGKCCLMTSLGNSISKMIVSCRTRWLPMCRYLFHFRSCHERYLLQHLYQYV